MNLAITRALLHFLWEGAVIGLGSAAILRVSRSARARYGVAALALLAMTAAFGLTLALSWSAQTVRVTPIVHSLVLPVPPQDAGGAAPDLASGRLSIPALVWMAGVLILYVRSLACWMLAERLRRVGVCAAPPIWQQRLEALARRVALSKPVVLLESCIAETPAVVGFFRPVVLIPLGLLSGLPPDQVEAILLHELAHIRRYDYAVNLLLGVVEGLLFYHPAVWWMARIVRAERENCCDDEVVAATGDRRGYASALASLERYRWTQSQAAAMAARGGNLVFRIRRILNAADQSRPASLPAFSVIAVLIATALLAAAWQLPQRRIPSAGQATPYEKWLSEDVVYIIDDAERAAFQRLQTDPEREHFIEQFWLRRDPTPGTVENEFKEEHYRRIAYANEKFTTATAPGWKTERGRVYIMYGPPDEIERRPAGGGSDEQWRYRHLEGVGENVTIEFPDVLAANARFSGAMVRTGPQGSTAVSVPLGSATYRISGRLMTSNSSPIETFTETAAGPVYTRPFALRPGAYLLRLTIVDTASGVLRPMDLRFSVP